MLIPGVDWLLDCTPRPVQLEALSRSLLGKAWYSANGVPIAPGPWQIHNGPARGWGHFLDMRLGKTATLLNEFAILHRDYGVKWLVVLSPNKFKDGWRTEALRLGLLDMDPFVFESGPKALQNMRQYMRGRTYGILVLNHESIRIVDVFNELMSLMASATSTLAVDESAVFRNRTAHTTKLALRLASNAAFVRALSGLPAPNSVLDLFSQFRLMGYLNNVAFSTFAASFAVMGGYKGYQVRGVKNESALNAMLSLCSFRARRQDWGTWHEPDMELVELGMTSKQKEMYATMERHFVAMLENGPTVSVKNVITQAVKLQQISSGYVLDKDGQVHHIEEFSKVPKVVDLLDRLDNYIPGKTIVLYHFAETGRLLRNLLKDRDIACIYGASDMARDGLGIESEKDRFNKDPSCRVLVGQISATKYGHTLVGTKQMPCETTIYLENSYSLDDRAQSEQRNQGAHQTGPVTIVDYASTRIEKRVILALQRKADIAAALMSQANAPLSKGANRPPSFS